jgi:hypothetical protein
MSKVKETKKKIKSKIEVIKKINDDPKFLSDSLYDKYLTDLPSSDELYGKKINDFTEKRKTKNENNKNIIGEIIDIFENFTTSNKKEETSTEEIAESSNRFRYKDKLKQHSLESSKIVLGKSKGIILDNVKKLFFVGENICGTEKSIPEESIITLDPKEFDFLNLLTIIPTSSMGQIVYEPLTSTGKEKVNRNIYNSFTDSNGYTFVSNSDVELFTMNWNTNSQQFTVSNFMDNMEEQKVDRFFDEYYSSIELPDIQELIKTTMLLTIQGDGSETPLFNKSINNLDRLLKKLFAICGTPTKRNDLSKQSPIDQFDENDEDPDFYFDFEDVEGIDLDNEDNRFRKVMKFTDCNNFEVPVNTTIINDFIYQSTKKNTNDLINDTLSRMATDVYIKSESSIPQSNFNLSLINTFILNVPKALIMNVLTPKVILPITLIYKMFKQTQVFEDVKIMMRSLSKMFYNIIKDMFWLYIRTFWRFVKKDLINYIRSLVIRILKNKHKRYVLIISTLISILSKILEDGIDNCEDLFNTILNTIDTALSAGGPFIVPGLLLSLSDSLPGYSQDRAFMNISERLDAAGISLEPIYGEDNDILSLVKSIVDGNTEEMDTNSFIKVVLKPSVIPVPPGGGGAIVPPGTISAVGKWF